MRRSEQTKAPSVAPKRKRIMLTIAQMLDMLEEGKDCVAVGRHYGVKESLVCCLRKEESTKFCTLRVFRQQRHVKK